MRACDLIQVSQGIASGLPWNNKMSSEFAVRCICEREFNNIRSSRLAVHGFPSIIDG